MEITENVSIEELIDNVPGAVEYLSKKGIQCVVCGEPVWGTLGEVAKSKGFSEEEIAGFVKDLKGMVE